MNRFCLAFVMAFILPAHAELADRDKPITLEADRITIDDLKRIQVFEGNVVLTQGSLIIHSNKIVVTEDAQGFQRGVATSGPGGLARFQQKREGRDELVEGEAERIEYDTHNEIAELFHRAWISSGGDQLRGDYIRYDGISEQYLASSIPGSARPTLQTSPQDFTPQPRVRAVIMPRNKSDAADTPSATDTPGATESPEPTENNLLLKNSPRITEPDRP